MRRRETLSWVQTPVSSESRKNWYISTKTAPSVSPPIDPRGVVLIFDDTVESELLYGIRFWENVDILTRVHTEYAVLYSDIQCQTYRHEGGLWAAEGEPVEHHIGAVPINPYYNNRMGLGDYEQILSLIDAYDATQSDSINDVEAFADAYLALIGMGDISFEPDDQNKPSEGEQAIRTMKNNRVLLIPEGGDAKWVVKNRQRYPTGEPENTSGRRHPQI